MCFRVSGGDCQSWSGAFLGRVAQGPQGTSDRSWCLAEFGGAERGQPGLATWPAPMGTWSQNCPICKGPFNWWNKTGPNMLHDVSERKPWTVLDSAKKDSWWDVDVRDLSKRIGKNGHPVWEGEGRCGVWAPWWRLVRRTPFAAKPWRVWCIWSRKETQKHRHHESFVLLHDRHFVYLRYCMLRTCHFDSFCAIAWPSIVVKLWPDGSSWCHSQFGLALSPHVWSLGRYHYQRMFIAYQPNSIRLTKPDQATVFVWKPCGIMWPCLSPKLRIVTIWPALQNMFAR